MLVPNYFEDLKVLHLNTQPHRAYYIPASTRRDDLVNHRENSDRFQLLSGQWKLRYWPSVREVTERFFEEGFDASGFDTVAVPSTWQSLGYDTFKIRIFSFRIICQIMTTLSKIIF